ncbi:MAG: glycine--tRNA ligase subunit beta [Thermoleophilia bacterium]
MPAGKETDGLRDFLFEIGTEELPAAAAASALSQAGALAAEAFTAQTVSIEPEKITVWVTPRRIAVYVRDVPASQEPGEIVQRGPRAGAAFDADGKPTGAAAGFARSKGVEPEELQVREFKGQDFVFAVKTKEALPTQAVLPAICRQILENIRFGKTMGWGGGGMRFSRPVRWLAAKFGRDTIAFEAAGLKCAGVSRGHRFLAPSATVEITGAADYRTQLAAAGVIVDQEERRRIILEGLATEAGKQGASFIDPAGELEEVIYLVENPSVHAGVFAEAHLRLPDMVLITAMQSHQRYFPLRAEDGSLMASFLYVMNGDPASAGQITDGNQRVLEGRIEDAEFSFDKDLATGIEAMTAGLEAVAFHRRLGSLAHKASRLWSLAETFADMVNLCGPDRKAAAAAAKLAKADLVSVMVQEFPDLQGYMGSVYAGMEGFPADVCQAVAEQYMPVAAGGVLPASVPGAVLAICDRVDNIIGAFSVDELPTGSRDPYGLRRAAAGLAEISSSFGFDFDLTALLAAARQLFIDQKADIDREEYPVGPAFEFVLDRIQQRQVEQGTPVELVEAARAAGLTSTLRLLLLTRALDEFRSQPAFEDLHTAYFRCSKIAAKAGAEIDPDSVDESLFATAAEEELHQAVLQLGPRVAELTAARQYGEALALAATIRPAVDRFFDDVLVMAKEEDLRRNRLALVLGAARMLAQLGDPMRVAAAPKEA